jgi:hypothetical protein
MAILEGDGWRATQKGNVLRDLERHRHDFTQRPLAVRTTRAEIDGRTLAGKGLASWCGTRHDDVINWASETIFRQHIVDHLPRGVSAPDVFGARWALAPFSSTAHGGGGQAEPPQFATNVRLADTKAPSNLALAVTLPDQQFELVAGQRARWNDAPQEGVGQTSR